MYPRLVLINILLQVLCLAIFWPLLISKLPRIKKILTLSLLTLPIIWFTPLSSQLIFLQAIFITCLWLMQKLPKKPAIFLFLITLIVFTFGTLLSGKIISWPFNFHPDRLIFDEPTIRDGIRKHQLDAVYVPFRLRLAIYNQLAYINYFFKNLAGLITVQRFYDVIFIANIYPLLLGIKKFINMKKTFLNATILSTTVITLICAGINKSTDPFNTLFFALPILTYLIIQGYTEMSEKLYLFLFVISIFIASTPAT